MTELASIVIVAAAAAVFVIRNRRFGPATRALKATTAAWFGSVTASDVIALLAQSRGPNPGVGWAFATEPALFLTAGLTVALLVMSHRRWGQVIADSWLLAASITLTIWCVVLAANPGQHDPSLLIGLNELLTALWMAAVGVMALPTPGFQRRGGILGVQVFLGLRAAAVLALFLESIFHQRAFGAAGAVVMAGGYAFLAVRPPRRRTRVTDDALSVPTVLAYGPYVAAAATGILGFTLAGLFPNVRQDSVFAFGALFVLVLAAGQIITAASHRGTIKALAGREQYFRRLVRDSTDVIMICSNAGLVEYLSPAALRIIGVAPEGVVGSNLATVLGLSSAQCSSALDDAINGPDQVVVHSTAVVEKATVDLETVLSAQDGRVICNIRDISERTRLQGQLHDLAYYDQLTGLPNRTRITEVVADTVRAARAGQAIRMPSVLFMDLDGFKKVNDAGGHDVGDTVLREVGQRLRVMVPEHCQVGRLGGDEFVIVVPDGAVTDPAGLADALVDNIRLPYETHAGTFVIGASVGIASLADADGPAALLRNADLASYEAKRNREGSRQFEPGMLRTAVARAELDAELASAVADDRLFLLFQPLIEISTGRVAGVEALLRWCSAGGTVGAPGPLVEFAERSGRATWLMHNVLDRALSACSEWAAQGLELRVSVNLTPGNLLTPGLIGAVRAALLEHRVPSSLLIIEITENALIASPQTAMDVINELRDIGVLVVIDDFGTGYSSMAYLIDLPMHGLKIDQSFVSRLDDTGQADLVIAGILQVAKTLCLAVVAEGIETAAQRDRVAELGCPVGQGYYFARPMPPQGVTEYAARQGVIPLEDLELGSPR